MKDKNKSLNTNISLKKLVLVESPYRGDNHKETELNIEYARKCMKDCFDRGEFPFASHLLYTQKEILDDTNPDERKLGIEAGLSWGECADTTVVYVDFGITEGMKQGIQRARECGRDVEMRSLKNGYDDYINRRCQGYE